MHIINAEILRLNRKNDWYFSFKVDDGNYETRIDCNDNGDTVLGNGKLPLIGFEMFCPDLLDWSRMLIIEYEESSKKSTGYFGAKKHKGHSDYTNTRDSRRDSHYRKFKVLKIWDYELRDESYLAKLESFLLNSLQ